MLVIIASVLQGVGPQSTGWLNGLKVVAVAVVGLAVGGMARTLAPGRPRATLAILAAIALLIWPNGINIAVAQVGVIVVAGLVGWRLLPAPTVTARQHTRVPITRATAIAAWVAFFALLLGLPVLRAATQS